MEIKDWIPITISALSLLVSAYTLFIQHQQFKERLKVKLSTALTLEHGDVSEPMFVAEVANIGQRSITVSSCDLQMPNKKVLLFPLWGQHVNLPHELLPGKSCKMLMPIQEVALALLGLGHAEVNLVLQFSTQSGKKFSSKPYNFNAHAWAK